MHLFPQTTSSHACPTAGSRVSWVLGLGQGKQSAAADCWLGVALVASGWRGGGVAAPADRRPAQGPLSGVDIDKAQSALGPEI
jgi:hypothetical protein